MKTKLLIGIALVLLSFCKVFSQNTCPPNIDFETGNFDHWQCFVGSTSSNGSNNVINLNPSSPQANRHTIMSSKTTMDPYGNFPVLCPFGGKYSVKLGNTNVGGEAEGISYTFTVPTTVDTFTFTYFYAVVFEDPGHPTSDQPRFFVSAYEVATGSIINCAAFNYVATSSLPGFYTSPTGNDVLYKNWTPVSLQFAGLMGKQVRLEFKNADCTRKGHFGYSYLDVSSGCTNILATAPYCIQTNSLTLNAPYGFQFYKWFNSDYTQVLGTSQTITLSPPPTVTGSLWVDAIPYPGFGCRDTFEAKVKPLSIPAIAGCPSDFYFCQYQQNATIDAFADSGNVFVWYVNDTTTSPGSELPPVIQTNVAGDFIYYVSQKQLFGCEGYKKKVTVHIISFSNTPINVNTVSQCLVGNLFKFSSSASNKNNITYSWYFGDNDSLITTSDSVVSHQYKQDGTFRVLLYANYFNRCTSVNNINVNVVPAPIADFNYNGPICEKQTVLNITDNSRVVSYTSSITRWFWEIDGQVSYSQTPLPLTPNVAKQIMVKLLVKTTEGCVSDTTIKVLDVHHKPKAFFDISSPLCSSETITITDRSMFDTILNNERIDKWLWTINNSTTYNSNNIKLALDTGFNKISLIAESDFGCKSNNYDSLIYVYRKPSLQLTLNDSCVNKSIRYYIQDTFKLVNNWYWDFGNGYYQATNTVTKVFSDSGNQPFSIIGSTIHKCTDTLQRNFHIYDNVAFAGNDTLVANDQPVYLYANGYQGEKYWWTPKIGLNSDTVENPVATYNHDMLYQLHSVTKEGCVKDSKIFIKRYVGPALYIASAFTPNRDNINDVLHVFPVGIKQFIHFSIYTRLGNLIFRTTDVHKGWDGTSKGVLLGNETFVVLAEAIDYRGIPLIYKGTVTLIK